MKNLSASTKIIALIIIVGFAVAFALTCCSPQVTISPAPTALEWISYEKLGIMLVFDKREILVGFKQEPPTTKGKVPVAYTTHLPNSASDLIVKPGMSPRDIEKLFGKPSAHASGTSTEVSGISTKSHGSRFIEYGKVLNNVLLLKNGFRSFEFSDDRLIKASEFYTDFHLSHGVSSGMTLKQVSALHGKPDAKGKGTDIGISVLY